jgi:SAM-dependent methyltransferase
MASSLKVKFENLSKVLAGDDYVSERLRPSASSSLYLHLVDLCESITLFRTTAPIRILDYGCGGSPYRSLFRNSEYIRADFTPCQGLDFLLPSDSSIPVPDASFDMVLSTQVLEHVPEPAHYIAESFRVLKPGGFLLLTTHGLFQDHGCPYDFHRWTADGLRLLLERAGFQIKGAKKLTCGPRALCCILNQWIKQLRPPKLSFLGFATLGLRALWHFNPSWLNRCADKYFHKYRMVDAEVPDNPMYIALLISGERRSL